MSDPTSNSDPHSPADDPRPAYVTSRLRYFDSEFLKTQDFVDEQSYHVDRRARHEQRLHAAGILEGLQVSSNGGTITVTQGSALDVNGNQILLWDAEDPSASQSFTLAAPAAAGTYDVYLRFQETPSLDEDGQGNKRFTQEPTGLTPVLFVQQPGAETPSDAVVIAVVTVDGGGSVTKVDTSRVVYAGIRLPGPRSDTTLRVAQDDKQSWTAQLVGNLMTTGSVSVGDTWDQSATLQASTKENGKQNSLKLSHEGSNLFVGSLLDGQSNIVSGPVVLQNTASGGHVLLNPGGHYVGIRTNRSPLAALEVQRDSAGSPALQVTDADGTTALLQVQANTVDGNSISSGDVRLKSGAILKIADEGRIESHDYNHTIRFRRSDGILEIREHDDIYLTAGSTVTKDDNVSNVPRLVVHSTGNVGVGLASITPATATAAAAMNVPQPAARLEVKAASSSAVALQVTSSTGTAVLKAQDSGLTIQSGNLTFPAPTNDPAPFITARRIPADQCGDTSVTPGTDPNSKERSELILFHGNDWDQSNEIYGPDFITLRAPAIRLQTYNQSLTNDIADSHGSNDRIYIAPDGKVGIGTASTNASGQTDYPNKPAARLEVKSAGSSEIALQVTSSTGTAVLKAQDDGTVQLANGAALFFADSGVIKSHDANHQILFRRPENILELREFGWIYLTAGAGQGGCNTSNVPNLVVYPSGRVGIGTATISNGNISVPDPGARLEIKAASGETALKVTGPVSMLQSYWSAATWSPGSSTSTKTEYDVVSSTQAASDGFVVATIYMNTKCGDSNGCDGGKGYIRGYTGSGSPSTSVLSASIHDHTGDAHVPENGFTMPVKKGEYWKVTIYVTDLGDNKNIRAAVRWMPLGQ